MLPLVRDQARSIVRPLPVTILTATERCQDCSINIVALRYLRCCFLFKGNQMVCPYILLVPPAWFLFLSCLLSLFRIIGMDIANALKVQIFRRSSTFLEENKAGCSDPPSRVQAVCPRPSAPHMDLFLGRVIRTLFRVLIVRFLCK